MLFLNDQLPNFCVLWVGSLPTTAFFPQARLTGLCGPSPPPVAISTSVAYVLVLPLVPRPNLIPEGGGELCPLSSYLAGFAVHSVEELPPATPLARAGGRLPGLQLSTVTVL